MNINMKSRSPFRNIFQNYQPCIIKPCESYQCNISEKQPDPYANSRQESFCSSKLPESFSDFLPFPESPSAAESGGD